MAGLHLAIRHEHLVLDRILTLIEAFTKLLPLFW